MNKSLLSGIGIGIGAALAVSGGIQLFKRYNTAKPNAWEQAFDTAELIVYDPTWGAFTETHPASAFESIHLVVDLVPNRVYKTHTPKGVRALIVSTPLGGPVAIYETSYGARKYAAVGNAAFMNKRIDGISIFISTIPQEYLVDVCDPTSAIYHRPEFDSYYDLNPKEIMAAAKSDTAIATFIGDIVDVMSEGEGNKDLLDALPELVARNFDHLTLQITEKDGDNTSDIKVGERQQNRVTASLLDKHIREQGGVSGSASNDSSVRKEISDSEVIELHTTLDNLGLPR